MSFNTIRENKILAKISEFAESIFHRFGDSHSKFQLVPFMCENRQVTKQKTTTCVRHNTDVIRHVH